MKIIVTIKNEKGYINHEIKFNDLLDEVSALIDSLEKGNIEQITIFDELENNNNEDDFSYLQYLIYKSNGEDEGITDGAGEYTLEIPDYVIQTNNSKTETLTFLEYNLKKDGKM